MALVELFLPGCAAFNAANGAPRATAKSFSGHRPNYAESTIGLLRIPKSTFRNNATTSANENHAAPDHEQETTRSRQKRQSEVITVRYNVWFTLLLISDPKLPPQQFDVLPDASKITIVSFIEYPTASTKPRSPSAYLR